MVLHLQGFSFHLSLRFPCFAPSLTQPKYYFFLPQSFCSCWPPTTYLPCICISLRCVCVSCVCFDRYISAAPICDEGWNCIILDLRLEEEARENRRKTSYCISTDNEPSLFNNGPCLVFFAFNCSDCGYCLQIQSFALFDSHGHQNNVKNVCKHIKPEKRKALLDQWKD